MKIFFVMLMGMFWMLMAFGKEAPGSFIIALDQGKIRVSGPEQISSFVNVTIENKGLERYHLKLTTKTKNLHFFSVSPGETKTLMVSYDQKESLWLVPMTPPLSDVELIFGKAPYEIPPKE